MSVAKVKAEWGQSQLVNISVAKCGLAVLLQYNLECLLLSTRTPVHVHTCMHTHTHTYKHMYKQKH